LAVSCAFAGPLLEPAHMENGGIHLISESSKGKSTALIVAGSVLGGGDSKYGYANTWKATANGLEAVAEAHNDLCLMLDEIQMVDPKEAADVAYMLANGQGKVRMTRSIGLRKRKGWRLLFLSSGELTLADHSASVGKRTRGGAEVRLLNIPADMGQGLGVLETLHGRETSEQFIDEIGAAAKRYYGAPIRAFIKAVIENREEVITALNAARQYMRQQVPKSASGEVFRAAARLAVVAAAGEYATHLGLTGWTKGEATAAAVSALKAWIEARGSTGHADEETALRQVRHFIEANGASRFEGIAQRFDKDGNEIRERIPNRAGYRGEHDGKAEFWILPEVWHKEVCAGLNSANVARWLHEKGYLRREDLKHLTCRENVPDVTKRIRVYCVKTEVLLGE